MTDYALDTTAYVLFNTLDFSQGIPSALTSVPSSNAASVCAYENNDAAQITAGITLSATHDSVTGLNLVTAELTAGNGFESGKDYHLVLQEGYVGGVSAAGLVVGRFTIGRAAASTALDDLTSATSRLEVSTTSIQAGTTMLSTDADDLIASTTLIQAESTATAAVVDSVAAGTTTLSTDADDLITSTTAIQAAVASSGVAVSTLGADTIWTKQIAELSTAMNGTPTVVDVLAFQHMKAWNLNITTASSGYDLIYNDAGTVIFTAAITNPTTDSFQRAQYTT